MLRLNVKMKSGVHIGNDIRVVVLGFNQETNSVELGFIAPKDVKILRDSLLKQKDKPTQGQNPNSSSQTT